MLCRQLIMLLAATTIASAAEYNLPAGRLPGGVRWTRASVGVDGGIPDSYTLTVYTNLTAAQTTATGINTAINNCPSNQVVQLTNGHFVLTASIEGKTGVVLRGNNPTNGSTWTNTVLAFSAGDTSDLIRGLIQTLGSIDGNSITKSWTAGLTQGSNPITVSDNTSLAVGQMVRLDQLEDSGIGADDRGETFLSVEVNRPQAQVELITGVSGTSITLTHAVQMTNYASGNTPELTVNGSSIVHKFGIENLTVSNAVATSSSYYNICFRGAWNCWVKDVTSYRAERAHVKQYWAGRIEVRESRFIDTFVHQDQSYGMNTSYYAAWSLIEDNIFQDISTPMFNWGAGGNNIFGYNFSITNRNDAVPTFLLNTMGTHGAHQTMCLYEGNYNPMIQHDYIHGSSSHNTSFRNRLKGRDDGITTHTGNTYPVIIDRRSWYISLVGNVLGDNGYHLGYRIQNSSSDPNENKFIFKLGYANTICSCLNLTLYDTEVTNTIVIHANYNTVDDAIPSAESLGSDTLANSWYYDSKPSWFGDRTWPPFDPVSPTLALTSKSYTNIPSGYRYEFGSDPPAAAEGGGSAPAGVATISGTVRLSDGVTIRQ